MYLIRKYKASDKIALRDIAMQTAWESYKKSQRRSETVAIMYNDYFTKYESENIFVVVDDDDIPKGYVVCSSNYEQFVQKHNEEFLPIAKALYRPIVWVYKMLSRILKKIDCRYRIHLHINLLPEAQRQGYGTMLLDALSNHLYNKGYKNMSVCGVSKRSGGYKFYKKYGFYTLKRHLFARETLAIETKELL